MPVASYPSEITGVDFLGLLPGTSAVNIIALVVVDHLTGLLVVTPIISNI